MKHLYALLAGVNDYLVPTPLAGCVADINEYEEFLEGRVDHTTHELHLRKLIDAQATRAAIIEGFQYLAQAGPADTALFVFCGHGSQQPSDPKHWKIEPDRKDETLVCYDSRTGGSDLADKEIARMLENISARGAHVVVILDSCHSGSCTRDAQSIGRSAPPRSEVGPAGYPPQSQNKKKAASGWTFAMEGSHILLAACKSEETAKEFSLGVQRRGVFSASLLETLKACPGKIAYQSLYESTAAIVRMRSSRQNPQWETSNPAYLDLPFLGGSVAARPRQFAVNRDPNGQWMLNLGAVHGTPTAGGETGLLLFPRGAPPERMKSSENAAGRAVISRVFPTVSQVRLDFVPKPGALGFEAFIESTSAPSLLIKLMGDPEGVQEIRNVLKTAGPSGGPSPFVGETAEDAAIFVDAKPTAFELYNSGEKSPIATVERDWSGGAKAVVEQLDHIARWRQIQEGVANQNSTIKPEEFKVSLFENGNLLQGDNLRLAYYEGDGEWHAPGFTIQLENSSNRDLNFALLALTDSFEITPLLREPCVALKPGQILHIQDGEVMEATLPKWLLNRGGTETVDVLKIIVCTSQFDGRLLRQSPLQEARSRSSVPAPVFARTNLNLLLNRMQSRTIGPKSEFSIDDWLATHVRITTVRPHAWLRVAPEGLNLSSAVRLVCPTGFSTSARLNSETTALETHLAPRILGIDKGSNAPFRFLEPCRNDPGLGALELRGFSGNEFVNADNPIRLNIAPAVGVGQYVLPFAWDGAYHLPLGYSETNAETTSICIERLPRVSNGNQEPIIRILFHRFKGASFPANAKVWDGGREWAVFLQALALNDLIKADWTSEELATFVEVAGKLPAARQGTFPVTLRTTARVPTVTELDLVAELLERMGMDGTIGTQLSRFFERLSDTASNATSATGA